MKPMEQKKEQKRAAIIQAALETFRSDGYVGTSMDSIANKAGVTKQTVYRYFNSKEVLFQASLEAQRHEVRSLFLDELDRDDARDALLHFAIGFLKVHMAEEHLAGIRLMVAEGPTAPEMTRAHFAQGPRKTEARLGEFITDRFQLDDPEYAIKVLLSTLLSMRMSVLVGLHTPPTQVEMEHHAERTVDIFMQLVS